MVVSADGLPVAVSDRLDRPMAEQLAAIASGVASLSQGRCPLLRGRDREADGGRDGRGLLLVMAVSDGSCLAVLAAAGDVGVVGYEMAVLVARAGEVLTRAELQAALPA
jgi:uncharacterized protein